MTTHTFEEYLTNPELDLWDYFTKPVCGGLTQYDLDESEKVIFEDRQAELDARAPYDE